MTGAPVVDWGLTTLVPVIRTGRAAFDSRRLPRDEFAERVRALETAAREQGLDAVVVLSHASTPAAAVYLTNFAPTARVAAVVVVPGHEPVLMAGLGGPREAPYQREVTWLHDLVQRPVAAATLTAVLAGRGVAAGRIGVSGLDDQLPVAAHDELVAGLSAFELVPVDDLVAALRRHASPRELAVLGDVDRRLGAALERALCTFDASGRPARAAITLEASLLATGCRDVRLLLGRADGSLRPVEQVDDDGDELFVCYVAAEYLGYWSERAVTYPWSSLPPAEDLRPSVAATLRALAAGPVRPEREAEGVRTRVRGLGVELVELPDPERSWESLEPGDPISVVAGSTTTGRVLLHSITCVLGRDGPAHLGADFAGG